MESPHSLHPNGAGKCACFFSVCAHLCVLSPDYAGNTSYYCDDEMSCVIYLSIRSIVFAPRAHHMHLFLSLVCLPANLSVCLPLQPLFEDKLQLMDAPEAQFGRSWAGKCVV